MAGVREPNGRRNYAMLLLIASHLRGEDRPAPRTAADPPGRGGGAGLQRYQRDGKISPSGLVPESCSVRACSMRVASRLASG